MINQRGVADLLFALTLLVLIVGGIVWLVGWSLFGWNPFSSEKTVYSVVCSSGELINDRCSGKIVLAGPEVYTAIPERQVVILQNLGNASPPVNLQECTVRDKNNWRCRTPIVGPLEMVDGNMRHSLDIVRYVSKWRWWLCKKNPTNCRNGWPTKG